MGSSGTGIGRAIKSNPEKLLLGPAAPLALAAGGAKEQAKAEAKESATAQGALAASLRESEKAKQLAQASTKAQKERARRRTLFAGASEEQKLFRKTLGGALGRSSLLGA